MDKKYLKTVFSQNEAIIQKVVNEKVAVLRSEIESLANYVFLIFDELSVVEQNLTIAQEEMSDNDKKFSFANFFLLLIVPTIYFIDLLLSQDAVNYLLPGSMGDDAKVFFAYLIPALFVIADLGIGLVRHKIKEDAAEDNSLNNVSVTLINVFGLLFCLILPLLVGATILAFTESAEIASSEIVARIALMLLSFILHYFVIFLFPKKAFDYCIGYNAYHRYRKNVEKKERELYKKINELSISVLNYKAKSDQYKFVEKLDKIEFYFRNRLLINQIAKSDAWNKTIEKSPQLQQIINDDDFLNRFFPYKTMPIEIALEAEEPEKTLGVTPVKEIKPKGIYITYVQNDSAFDYGISPN
jgi:hypothetical protein